MRRLPPLSVTRPDCLEDACARIEDSGGEATAYAGGTELLLALKLGLLAYKELVDIKGLPGLRGIEQGPDGVRIGAATTHREIERDPLISRSFPMLRLMASQIANARVRTSGTIGGNLAFAEPRSDLATVLLACDAVIEVAAVRGRRRVPVTEFILGAFEPAIVPGDLITGVHVPLPDHNWSDAYVRYQLYERPTLGVAVRLQRSSDRTAITDARIAIGCVEPTARRHPETERELVAPVSRTLASLPETARRLAQGLETADDEDGSADYKRDLVAVYLQRAVQAAVQAT